MIEGKLDFAKIARQAQGSLIYRSTIEGIPIVKQLQNTTKSHFLCSNLQILAKIFEKKLTKASTYRTKIWKSHHLQNLAIDRTLEILPRYHRKYNTTILIDIESTSSNHPQAHSLQIR